MYKTYIETKHENRDHLGPSEMGSAGYLLTDFFHQKKNSLFTFLSTEKKLTPDHLSWKSYNIQVTA